MQPIPPLGHDKLARPYREVLNVSLPLVVGMSTTLIMEFTDRVFLANYDLDAIAAALPGGIVAFLAIIFFVGVANYLNVFVAQYMGAGHPWQVGRVLWQGLYFAILAWAVLSGLSLLAPPIFSGSGHPPEIRRLEAIYFQTLCLGAGLHVLATVLACFFTGRGITRPVMVVNFLGMLVNIPLDYALINGAWCFPELGILGAGLATIAGWLVTAVLFAIMVFTRKNELEYGVLTSRQLDLTLFRRLMRFGVPGSLQFCLDVLAFTFFVFMVGRIGKIELAATNIVMSVNHLAFTPMMGFSLGLTTLVGRALGSNRPHEAARFTQATLHIAYGYIGLLVLVFLAIPQPIMGLFKPGHMDAVSWSHVAGLGGRLLKFVCVFMFFDAQYLVFMGVLKGAGDIRFIMTCIGAASFFVMVMPLFLGIVVYGQGVFFAWSCVTLFIFTLFSLSFGRYLWGKWRLMRVIESPGAEAVLPAGTG